MASLDELLAPFLANPSVAAVCTDFDGTLSPIVDDPAAARPLDGVVDALAACGRRYARTAVLSGRPVAYLRSRIDAGITLSGLYGLEVVEDGVLVEHPEGQRWRAIVAEVADRAEAGGPSGLLVERKGLSLTLHYRTRPDLADAALALAEAEAARSGLRLGRAKASLELHPPIAADKGTAMLDLVRGLEAVCFLGDDVGDLPAFDALARLAGDGVHTLGVVVGSAETPDAVRSRADVVVDGPEGALAVLRRLAEG